MNPFRNRGLLTKINLVIAAILLTLFALSTYLSYRQQKAFCLEEAVEKARIFAFEAIRTREYLSNQYQRGQVRLSVRRYGLIPVVASNRIGKLVSADLGYRVRQVSDRFRNPQNAPDSFESKMLRRFYADPTLREDYAVTALQGAPVFRYLRAFTADESCLKCHGKPENAPGFIKTLFPKEKDQAYNYKIGQVIGAASVTIPMAPLYRQIYINALHDGLYTGGIFLALITFLGLLIRGAVTRPLGRLGAAITSIVHTGRFEQKIPRRGQDEIGRLIDGFNEMIDHLKEKTEHLEESERRFRTLTETARDAIISFLGNGQIILFNRQAERWFGYSKREVLGVSIAELIHEDCASLHQRGVETFLKEKTGELVRQVHRITGRRRDGSPLPLELSLSEAESDGHLFYTAILRDQGPHS
jgi:PAS domain S-box-containing protein